LYEKKEVSMIYNAFKDASVEDFKLALFKEYDVVENPKAEKLFWKC
jgi:phage regulator Rha-like protein